MNISPSQFGTIVFIPHGQCYLWQTELIGLHAVADALISLAYYSIPLIIFYFVRKRRDLPFSWIFLMFGAFIVACGTTHVIDVLTIWQPHYWLAGWVKVGTAVISLATAVSLVRIVPKALKLPSPDDLRKLNESLEDRVKERTAELIQANEQMKREMNQRVQAEAEVRRLNESLGQRVVELQTLIDLLPVGIGIAHDVECRRIQANPLFADMLGVPVNSNTSLSAPPPERPSAFKVFQGDRELNAGELPMQRAAAENQEIADFEIFIRRNDGRELLLLVNAVPLRDATGRARGCLATFQDVTRQRSDEKARIDLERKMRETQKLESLGILAGGIAHDFNNLLTGVLANASLARLEVDQNPVEAKEMLGLVEQSARRAGDLCRQMLAYAGKGRFVVQPVDLSQLVRETTELLEISINKKCLLQMRLAERIPVCQGDSTQIRQVLMNLVINASESIGQREGVITIVTGGIFATREYLDRMAFYDGLEEGLYVCMEVSDTGDGMDRATMTKIFDPFFTTKFTGRGLGLAAVLGIIRSHKGAIKVYSEPGRGTSFKILFPAAGEAPLPPPPPAPELIKNEFSGTILVVDDEDEVRNVAMAILERMGFETVPARDGREAVEIVRSGRHAFAAVLMDLTMPVMDGQEAFCTMSEIDPGLRVLLMSGFNEQDVIGRFVEGGLAGFLAKPFTADMLREKLREILPEAAGKR